MCPKRSRNAPLIEDFHMPIVERPNQLRRIIDMVDESLPPTQPARFSANPELAVDYCEIKKVDLTRRVLLFIRTPIDAQLRDIAHIQAKNRV